MGLKTNIASIKSLDHPDIQKLHSVFSDVEEWLLCAGKNTIRQFFLQLIRGICNTTVLKRLVILFSTACKKDYVYSRSRCNPGLQSDKSIKAKTKDFSAKRVDQCILNTRLWFKNADDHCKLSFILFVAKLCVDTGLTYQAYNLCKSLLWHKSVFLQDQDATESLETTSLDSSMYSFHTDDHPHLYQMASVLSDIWCIDKSEIGQPRRSKQPESQCKKNFTDRGTLLFDDRATLVASSSSAVYGISSTCDFISNLPIHLSKIILGMLSRFDLSSCALVNSRWLQLVSQVRADAFSLQIIKEETILMQGVSSKGSNARYANFQTALVPLIEEDSGEFVQFDSETDSSPYRHASHKPIFESIFEGLQTRPILIEERNIYCGAYNLLVLDHKSNAKRIIGYAGEENMVIAFADKVIRTVDISIGRDKRPYMQGHPASVTSLLMGSSEQGFLFSGSYDTTIRKWNLSTGSCQAIYHGHRKSVTSFDIFDNILVSGAQDGLVKVWNINKGECFCTFKHSRTCSVTSVQILDDIVASSCERGLIRIWSLTSKRLVKTLDNHGGHSVNCLRINDHFLLSGGSDDYLLLWTLRGKHSICLKAYRHPKAILCVEFLYMCAITGCADGKIRVINILSGECLRLLRGNSQCDPIIQLCATERRLVVNTQSNCLVMHFEAVDWEYETKYEEIHSSRKPTGRLGRPISSRRSIYRANRLNLSSASDKRIFKRFCWIYNEISGLLFSSIYLQNSKCPIFKSIHQQVGNWPCFEKTAIPLY